MVGKPRILIVYFLTIIIGYALFVAPNLYFGIFKPAGGLTGLNFAAIGVFELVTVCLLVRFSLKRLGRDFRFIGWDFSRWRRDTALGAALGLAWALVEMLLIIPQHGGAAEPNVARIIEGVDGEVAGMVGYMVLALIGGGITEEILNRGFAINVLRSVFANPKIGLWIASVFSMIIFMLGHMPVTALDWVTILIPTVIYTVLFVGTGRLAAPIAAHAVHNAVVLAIIYAVYLP